MDIPVDATGWIVIALSNPAYQSLKVEVEGDKPDR